MWLLSWCSSEFSLTALAWDWFDGFFIHTARKWPLIPQFPHVLLNAGQSFRAIVLPRAIDQNDRAAGHAARVALFMIRRGLNFVPTEFRWASVDLFQEFKAREPEPPPGYEPIEHRSELAA